MKALKAILYIVGGILALALIVAIFLPKSGRVERSVLIKAPKEVIWEKLKDLNSFKTWSPWNVLDPSMKVTIEGAVGVGQKYSWVGNDQVGSGSMEVKALDEMKRVDIEVKFLKPWESTSPSWTTMNDSADGVAVTWGFDWKMSYPMNVMCLFMNMDKMVGDKYAEGLENFKKMCESAEAPTTNYEIKEEAGSEIHYLGVKKNVSFKEIGDFFGKNFPEIGKKMGMAKIEMAGAPSGLMFTWDEKKEMTDMAAAMPVKDGKAKVSGLENLDVKAGKWLAITYFGDYMKTKPAHEALNAYMVAKGYKMCGPAIEEYITDPMTEKDTAKWQTNIKYPVE
jgi:effector-binding domain-containing protein/uncharacterized protein YndB with AHSA1/START domain